MLGRLIKFLVFLILIAGIAVVGYSFVGDMSSRAQPQSITVILPSE